MNTRHGVSMLTHEIHKLYILVISNIFISLGGDDSKFKSWDLRLIGDQASNPATINNRFYYIFNYSSHNAGVCSIQSHPNNEHLMATGR